ncbi:translation initiation factor IF-3, mitochondrial [Chanos chanos]|uniref:Translation initiation factor IF-3, mitochondrial n=1 Tax=Chanos chanos TaxID=29144 RepID=A0A6J2WVT0_CHACN|nr:translation initiation factor IF-3, mitochondrial [Chanos chanos]
MTLGCLRLALCHAVRGACTHHYRAASPSPLTVRYRPSPLCPVWGILGRSSLFSTEAEGGGGEETELQRRKKKQQQDPRARVTIGNVGRKIPQRHIQLLGAEGEDLGTMHRADVVRLMDQNGLKLVPVNEKLDPPVYRLMSGKQIHEEQLKLREKQKSKAGPVQVKELTMSADIAPHDLDTKLRQVQSWLDKKHHVRVTLKTGHPSSSSSSSNNTQPLDSALEDMVGRMAAPVGFVSKPRVIREGRAAMCILRPPSAKELREHVAKIPQSQHPARARPGHTRPSLRPSNRAVQHHKNRMRLTLKILQ